MTLQQKLLAKKSKKGFTLVELVVVIAILAILAAIAIPAVVGIINSASESSTESDAATINSAVKTFHSGIVSGTINSSDKATLSKVSNGAQLPSKTASNKTRTSYANNVATLRQAMEYDGIFDTLSSKVTGGDFGVDKAGNVVAAIDGNGSAVSGVTAFTTYTIKIGGIMEGNVVAGS